MKSFDERLKRLEELSDTLKAGDLPLEKAVAQFEEGITLARSLEKELAKVERRIEILVNEPEKGKKPPALELFPELDAKGAQEPQEDPGGSGAAITESTD
jgi:exodeoxyribonuclease VII small subunit